MVESRVVGPGSDFREPASEPWVGLDLAIPQENAKDMRCCPMTEA